ncbi:Uu.00g142000.m01.CDS01 [Anthostomella pinea]|uniref:Uu.00g142000.m01.CDS01 n=1 Tax=Anthostomella pinea TaxID=933095 RepID=A0AAI8VR16_9PEZI|nr:Uu.00g142000.m01.CDS01 [Anthostomella pinea]
MKDLSKRVAETKQPSAVSLFNKTRRIARSGKGYLPAQLQQPLEDKLGLSDDDADKFVTRDPLLLDEATLARRKVKARRLLGKAATDADLSSSVLVGEPLEAELERL